MAKENPLQGKLAGNNSGWHFNDNFGRVDVCCVVNVKLKKVMRCQFCNKKIKKGKEVRITESPKDKVGMRIVICEECYEDWEEKRYKYL